MFGQVINRVGKITDFDLKVIPLFCIAHNLWRH